MKRIVIVGASGLLGNALYNGLGHYYEIAGTYHDEKDTSFRFLDITSYHGIEKLFSKINPDIVIHCAANIDSDFVEKNREAGKEINEGGTKNIAKACRRFGCKLIYISSDYVFGQKDGVFLESDECAPINYYGETKFNGEELVKKMLDDYIILRPTMLYGFQNRGKKKSFVPKIIEQLEKGEKVSLDNKAKKYPVLIDDVTSSIKTFIDLNEQGIFHIGSSNGITRFEIGKAIATEFGFAEELVTAEKEKDREAKRPNDLRLDTRKLNHLGIIPENFKNGIAIIHRQMGCSFKMIYSLRPDRLVLGQNTSQFRISVGRKLAENDSVDADIVVPIPESGIYCGTGYAAESKIPLFFGLIRDYYTLRTLYEPKTESRSTALRKKLIVVSEIVKDKKIILVDEALLSGSTIEAAALKLKEAGVKEIHVRIPSPLMLSNCHGRVLRRKVHLIARDYLNGGKVIDKKKIEESLTERFRVTSFKLLDFEVFLSCMNERQKMCYDCFTFNDEYEVG